MSVPTWWTKSLRSGDLCPKGCNLCWGSVSTTVPPVVFIKSVLETFLVYLSLEIVTKQVSRSRGYRRLTLQTPLPVRLRLNFCPSPERASLFCSHQSVPPPCQLQDLVVWASVAYACHLPRAQEKVWVFSTLLEKHLTSLITFIRREEVSSFVCCKLQNKILPSSGLEDLPSFVRKQITHAAWLYVPSLSFLPLKVFMFAV